MDAEITMSLLSTRLDATATKKSTNLNLNEHKIQTSPVNPQQGELEQRKRFAEVVRDLRAGRKYRAFAKLVGVSHSTIVDWENCNVSVSDANLEKIAFLRGQTLQELKDYVDGKNPISHIDRLLLMVNGASKEQLAVVMRAIAARLESI
ncbi:XRE family transcriptional regulator [Cylindrospermum sp. FACHB-282]|uniref:XRE family transcriptional regulator n=1 Tax=Cylindrospermum sp. FACHB-282 TaxID=2692794 RepID=UPI00168526D8|nr:XRE family transcriptional regulator [Cylindrospermum sp. FACHB-282]MBD2386042.1 XRE family transcriptional regulator [Cylindrospermum sp. FACHB-282]